MLVGVNGKRRGSLARTASRLRRSRVVRSRRTWLRSSWPHIATTTRSSRSIRDRQGAVGPRRRRSAAARRALWLWRMRASRRRRQPPVLALAHQRLPRTGQPVADRAVQSWSRPHGVRAQRRTKTSQPTGKWVQGTHISDVRPSWSLLR